VLLTPRVLGPLLLALLLGPRPCPGSTASVVFQAGDAAADGTRLDSIENPVPAGPSAVAFRGGTSAILLAQDGAFTVVARTGDLLPAPLVGAFNGFGDPVINDAGAIAFRAGLNSPSGAAGVFLWEAGTFLQVGRATGLAVGINAGGDVLLRARNAINLWSRVARTNGRVVDRRSAVPGGGRFVRFGRRAVVNDAGTVVFQAEARPTTGSSRGVRGIYLSRVGAGPTLVAREGDQSPIPGGVYGRFRLLLREPGEAVAINADGTVAFTAPIEVGRAKTFAVLVHEPPDATRVVAQIGDIVGGALLTGIPADYVGIDTEGRVVFKGCTGPDDCRLIRAAEGTLVPLTNNIERLTSGGTVVHTAGFPSRLPDSGRVVWRSGDDVTRFDGSVAPVLTATDVTPIGAGVLAGAPTTNDAGAVAFVAGRESVYLSGGGVTRSVVSSGDTLLGGGALRSFGVHAADGDRIALVGHEGDGRTVIALAQGGTLAKVAADGDPTPLGGTFEVGEESIGVNAAGVVFAADVNGGSAPGGIFRARPTGAIEVVAREGARAPGGFAFEAFETLKTDGSRVVFTADLTPRGRGLYATRGRRIVRIARTGKRIPGQGRRRIDEIGEFSASEGRVLFAARRDRETGLFLWGRGKLQKLVPSKRRRLSLGRVASGFPALGVGDGTAAFVAALDGQGPARGLFLYRRGEVVSLLMTGAPAPTGGTFDLLATGEAISVLDTQLLLRANIVQGAGSRTAVLSIAP
jgi:hypothetical protein